MKYTQAFSSTGHYEDPQIGFLAGAHKDNLVDALRQSANNSRQMMDDPDYQAFND